VTSDLTCFHRSPACSNESKATEVSSAVFTMYAHRSLTPLMQRRHLLVEQTGAAQAGHARASRRSWAPAWRLLPRMLLSRRQVAGMPCDDWSGDLLVIGKEMANVGAVHTPPLIPWGPQGSRLAPLSSASWTLVVALR
jgi:outer membrane murein-binding lipoprotein Lpp